MIALMSITYRFSCRRGRQKSHEGGVMSGSSSPVWLVNPARGRHIGEFTVTTAMTEAGELFYGSSLRDSPFLGTSSFLQECL
jgi:hypothetical protein